MVRDHTSPCDRAELARADAIAHAGEDPHLVPEFLCAFNRLSLKYRERFPSQLDVLT
jgi:hypothetical protein